MTDQTPFEAWLEEFESAWRSPSPPAIGEYVQKPDVVDNQAFLVALLEMDLEYRWKQYPDASKRPDQERLPTFPSVADYRSALSVALSSSATLELILQEFRLRNQWGGGVSLQQLVEDNNSILSEEQILQLKAKLEHTIAQSSQRVEDTPRSGHIGPYKILQKIAEGGMGAVYMADQEKPIRRRVALKLIKGGVEGGQIIARFEAERQALAMMDHPNIAKILDAGTTDDGSPYFVMELVKGIPITEYCDQNKLSVRERLELLIPVCAAVQHAHQKGIIHRDLKPSNILVACSDGVPIPKVIDFGLAKSLEPVHRLTDKTLFTEFGSVLGTLQYMSPEQAEFNHLDVDTRTDIYALGAILYELLTGSPPIDRATLKNHAFLQVLKLIKEYEPENPSDRISDTTRTAPGVSQRRRIAGPGRLQQLLQGELDWIVMRAIERDRARRYETVGSLREDVARYLANEPVSARPPGQIYLLKKFTSRNWKTLTALFVTLGLTITALVSFSVWAEREKHNQIQLQQANARAARSDYRSALNFRKAGRMGQFIEQLERVPPEQRQIEWRLARNANMGQIVNKHKHAVFTVAVSADGNLVASAGSGAQILIRDLSTSTLKARIIEPHAQELVRALVFHPGNPNVLVSGGSDGYIRFWDIESGKQSREVKASDYEVRTLDFNRDGSRLLAGGGEKITKKDENPFGWLSIWNPDTLEREVTFEGHADCVHSAQFSPDDSLVLSGSRDLKIHIWQAETGQLLHAVRASSYVWDVAWHPDGRWFASATEDNFVWLHEMTSQQPRLRWKRSGPSTVVFTVSFSDDGSQLATGCYNGTVKLWDTGSGEEIRLLKGHTGLVRATEFIPGQDTLLSGSQDPDQTVRSWDVSSGPESMTLAAHTQSVNAISFSQDGQLLASVSGTHEREPYPYRPDIEIDNSLKVWDVSTGQTLSEHRLHTDTVTDVEFDPRFPNGRCVATSSLDGTIRLWDRQHQTEVLQVNADSPVYAIRFNTTGTSFASAGQDGVLKLWTTENGSLAASIPVQPGTRLTCLDWSEDDQTIVVGSVSGEVTSVDVASLRPRWNTAVEYETFAVGISPDGKYVLSGNGGTSLTMLDGGTGEIQRTISNHLFSAYSIDFYSEGQTTRMLTGSHNGDWKLWDLTGMEELSSVRPFSKRIWNHIFDARVSPDGERIAIACSDGFIRIWDCSRKL